MRYMFAALIAVVALSGCAMSYERQQVEAKSNTNDELCLVVQTRLAYRVAAQAELNARGAQCDASATQALADARREQGIAELGAVLETYSQTREQNRQQVRIRSFLSSQWQSGNLRYCKYQNGVINTISTFTFCPQTIE